MTKIKVTYQSVDRFRMARSFRTIEGARAFAQRRLGPHPDLGSGYAVSFDGIGTITVQGARLADLFPETAMEDATSFEEGP
jgi:hypothetical protein